MSEFYAKVEGEVLHIAIPMSAKESEKMILVASSGGWRKPEEPVEFNGEELTFNIMAGYYKPRAPKIKSSAPKLPSNVVFAYSSK
jgi:hypothetical protein